MEQTVVFVRSDAGTVLGQYCVLRDDGDEDSPDQATDRRAQVQGERNARPAQER